MSYKASASNEEHAEIEAINKMKPEEINDLLCKQHQEIKELKEKLLTIEKVYIKLTNSDYVLDDCEEISGYLATHEIMCQLDELFLKPKDV